MKESTILKKKKELRGLRDVDDDDGDGWKSGDGEVRSFSFLSFSLFPTSRDHPIDRLAWSCHSRLHSKALALPLVNRTGEILCNVLCRSLNLNCI